MQKRSFCFFSWKIGRLGRFWEKIGFCWLTETTITQNLLQQMCELCTNTNNWLGSFPVLHTLCMMRCIFFPLFWWHRPEHHVIPVWGAHELQVRPLLCSGDNAHAIWELSNSGPPHEITQIMHELSHYLGTLLVLRLQLSSRPTPCCALKMKPVGVDTRRSTELKSKSHSIIHTHPVCNPGVQHKASALAASVAMTKMLLDASRLQLPKWSTSPYWKRGTSLTPAALQKHWA